MFAPLQNDTFLRACLRQATSHTPVWLMRQAGRYLPEYRATRAQAGSFMGLATNVDYATEVTLQPLERYPLDASIRVSGLELASVAAASHDGHVWADTISRLGVVGELRQRLGEARRAHGVTPQLEDRLAGIAHRPVDLPAKAAQLGRHAAFA